jgi:hypothetical protein
VSGRLLAPATENCCCATAYASHQRYGLIAAPSPRTGWNFPDPQRRLRGAVQLGPGEHRRNEAGRRADDDDQPDLDVAEAGDLALRRLDDARGALIAKQHAAQELNVELEDRVVHGHAAFELGEHLPQLQPRNQLDGAEAGAAGRLLGGFRLRRFVGFRRGRRGVRGQDGCAKNDRQRRDWPSW